jgi:hypothetical protein
MGDDRHWWQPEILGGRFRWANNVSGDGLQAWTTLFLQEGYEVTEDWGHEPGYEKVAIYVDLKDMLPSHVAKSDGAVWKSKLGKLQDIAHTSLDLLEGDQQYEYGIVDRVLRRRASL